SLVVNRVFTSTTMGRKEPKGQLTFPPSAKGRSRRRHWVLRTLASVAVSSIVHHPARGRSPRTDPHDGTSACTQSLSAGVRSAPAPPIRAALQNPAGPVFSVPPG